MSDVEPSEMLLTEAEVELAVSTCLMRASLIIAAGGDNPALDALKEMWPDNASADSLEIGTQVAMAMAAAFAIDHLILAEVANDALPSDEPT